MLFSVVANDLWTDDSTIPPEDLYQPLPQEIPFDGSTSPTKESGYGTTSTSYEKDLTNYSEQPSRDQEAERIRELEVRE